MKYPLNMGDEVSQALAPQMRILDVIGSNPRKPPPHPRYMDAFLLLNSEFLRTRIQICQPNRIEEQRSPKKWTALERMPSGRLILASEI